MGLPTTEHPFWMDNEHHGRCAPPALSESYHHALAEPFCEHVQRILIAGLQPIEYSSQHWRCIELVIAQLIEFRWMKPPNGNDVVSWCLCPGEHCAKHHKPDCPCGDENTRQGVEVASSPVSS